MLGGPSALEQPSTSWGSTGAQSATQPLPESPAIGSIPHCSHPSTSYPHAALTPNNSAKTDHCSVPSTSFAETPRQSSSASSEEPVAEMTSSSASPYRRLHLTFRLPARKAQRLKRIASFQPQTLRRIGVSRLKVGKDGEAMTIADPAPPPQPPPLPRQETIPRTEQTFDRIEPRPQPSTGQFAPPPGVPPEGAMQMQPRPIQMSSNSSPLLVNLLSNQPQGREAPPQNGPPSVHPAAAQRSFSPYQYPPQQAPHPVTPGVVDPQIVAMQQQERHRMMIHQQQQMQHAQHAAAIQAQSGGHPPPGTPGCVPQQQPFFNPAAVPPHQQVRPQVPVNYPQTHPQQAPPPAMYNPQQPQRMAPPQYPAQPQMAPAPMAQPPPFMPRPAEEQTSVKKKRKPTKRQQQKEAEMAAQNAAAQQQFMAQQGMMPQQHPGMQHPGMPIMGQNFPQGYAPQYGYPPGATQQQQQQMWQHQMQQRMIYQQQPQGVNPQWHQRSHVPYPPGTPMDGPASVHPVSQRPSSEFGTDGTSPMTPHSFPPQQQQPPPPPPQQQQQQQQQQPPGMVNGAFMRHDSHGNLFNFNQPSQSTTADPLDQFLQKDDTCDLGDLDDIDVKPMGDLGAVLPADILDEASSSSSTMEKQPAPSTPNGDRIDSSIASVVEMVSKSNATQPTMTNVSQATAMSGTNFRIQQGFGNGGHQQYGIQQQTQGNEQRPPSKTPKIENGAVFANGHHQMPNGATKRSANASNDDEEQIDQYVKSLIVADEERRKAADAGTKAKTQRKSRKKDTGALPQPAIS